MSPTYGEIRFQIAKCHLWIWQRTRWIQSRSTAPSTDYFGQVTSVSVFLPLILHIYAPYCARFRLYGSQMALPLSVLPTEILDRIVSFDDVPGASLMLWKCNCRSLQYQLARSVRRVVLRSPRRFTWNPIPQYLGQLTALRSLTIERACRVQDDFDTFVRVLLQVGSRLEELRLNLPSWPDLLWELTKVSVPSARETSCSGDASSYSGQLDLTIAFPNLKTLGLEPFHMVGLPKLPPSLTWLHMSLPYGSGEENSVIASLPRSLVRFSSQSMICSSVAVSSIPPNIERLGLYMYLPLSQAHLEMLPGTLTSLGTQTHVELNAHTAPLLPSGLTELSVYKTDPTILQELIPQIPRSVRKLALSRTKLSSSEVKHLPRALTSLTADLPLSELEIDDLPPSLISLEVRTSSSINKFSSVLPPLLTSLNIECFGAPIEPSSICNLPSTLTRLRIHLKEPNDSIELPPNLRTLIVVCDRLVRLGYLRESDLFDGSSADRFISLTSPPECQTDYRVSRPPLAPKPVMVSFPFHKIPSSVSNLQFIGGSIPYSSVKDLPPMLKKLVVQSFVYDVEWFKTEIRPRKMERSGMVISDSAGSIDEFVSYASPPTQKPSRSTCILGALPRSLTSLKVRNVEGLDRLRPKEFSALPPRLNFLDISGDSPTRLHEDCLLYIPMSHMKSLSVKVRTIEERHLRALGTHIQSLQVCPSFFSKLPESAVRLVPCEADPETFGNALLSEPFKKLTEQRLAATDAKTLLSLTAR